MTAITRQALVGDIGGTNARFAIADIDELTISDFANFRCDMFASLPEAIAAYLDSIPHRPAMAGLAVAAPVNGDRIQLTNRPWTFTRTEIADAAGVERLHLVNDYEALALCLPHLTAHDLHGIGAGRDEKGAPMAVVGPGTGLGVAALVRARDICIGVAGEGGHVSFAPQSAADMEIVEQIRQAGEHVSAEKLISGPGLVRLYKALGDIRSRAGAPAQEIGDAAEVVARALSGDDALAAEALDYFVTWLGRFAGDIALLYGARGGVYLGGGIVPKILAALDSKRFLDAFRSKGRLTSFLEPVPVHVIMAADAGLRGAAVALSASLSAPGG